MSLIEEVLKEEYERLSRIERSLMLELDELPKGSIQKKKIKERYYYYLMYRDGEKIKSQYLSAEEVPEIRKLIDKRKEDEKALKEIRNNKEKILKSIGKEAID